MYGRRRTWRSVYYVHNIMNAVPKVVKTRSRGKSVVGHEVATTTHTIYYIIAVLYLLYCTPSTLEGRVENINSFIRQVGNHRAI